MIANALGIKGWMTSQELTVLAEIASRSHLVIEVGSYHGRSSRAIADNLPFDGRVFCVDPWAGAYYGSDGGIFFIHTDSFEQFHYNLRDHIVNGKVIPVQSYFSLINQVINESPDFIFIDGDHRYDKVKADIQLAQELIKDDGIIAGHDYNDPLNPGVKQAVDEAFGDTIDVSGTIWIKKF